MLARTATIDEVHSFLSEMAADIANRDPRLYEERSWRPPLVSSGAGAAFRNASHKSSKFAGEGLCIDYDEALLEGKDQAWINEMARIGRDAMQKALVTHKSTFVGAMVGLARQGTSYFEYFA